MSRSTRGSRAPRKTSNPIFRWLFIIEIEIQELEVTATIKLPIKAEYNQLLEMTTAFGVRLFGILLAISLILNTDLIAGIAAAYGVRRALAALRLLSHNAKRRALAALHTLPRFPKICLLSLPAVSRATALQRLPPFRYLEEARQSGEFALPFLRSGRLRIKKTGGRNPGHPEF